jgi:hypothetical protein
MRLKADIAKRIHGLTRREKALVVITAMTLAWFALDTATKPLIAEHTQRRDLITYLESEKERIGRPLSGLPGLEKKLIAEKGENALLRERVLKLSERLKLSDSSQGGGLDFLQSIVSGANLSVAEVNISSEPLKATEAPRTERMSAPGSAQVQPTRAEDEPQLIRSRVVLKVETGFRELAALVNRVESTRLPLVMRRLDVVADTPGYPRALKMEIEMDVFSL